MLKSFCLETLEPRSRPDHLQHPGCVHTPVGFDGLVHQLDMAAKQPLPATELPVPWLPCGSARQADGRHRLGHAQRAPDYRYHDRPDQSLHPMTLRMPGAMIVFTMSRLSVSCMMLAIGQSIVRPAALNSFRLLQSLTLEHEYWHCPRIGN